MNLTENLKSSITGNVEKAILCVKKPVSNNANNSTGSDILDDSNTGMTNISNDSSSNKNKVRCKKCQKMNVNADLKQLAKNKKALDTMFPSEKVDKSKQPQVQAPATVQKKEDEYHILQVKYNPTRISFSSRAGSFIYPGPGGQATNDIAQVIVPTETYMSFEILFDAENHQDAFMFDKFTNLSAGALVSDVAGIVKNVKDGGYSVKKEVEAMIGMLTQSETRHVIFYWSDMRFEGDVTALSAKYTMFNPSGNPIRAVVSLTIQEAEESGDTSYWDTAFDNLGRNGSKLDKAANLLNFK